MEQRRLMSRGVCAVALGVALPGFAAEPAAITPQQLADQVRAQQRGDAPSLAPVPSITDLQMPLPRVGRRAPTMEDKAKLEAQLKEINSALKIKEATDRGLQHASDAIAVRGQMLFNYAPGSIYEVNAATFHETALQLQAGEVLTGSGLPTAGDTARWTIAATKVGSPPEESVVLIVKPLDADLETNMTITTNRRLYTVILKSSDQTYMPLVGWLYPADLKVRQETERKVEAQPEAVAVQPESLNFNCDVTGSKVAWRPLRAYDDGSKTYLQMDPQMKSYEAPAIFVMDGNTPMLVNFRVKNSTYIVDRLFDRAQLRIGPKTAVDVRCVHRFASR